VRQEGDTWRWGLDYAPTPATISVIEPAVPRKEPEGAMRVPFGFSRVLGAAPAIDRDGWDDHAAALCS